MFEQEPSAEPTLVDALRDFLPLCVNHLQLKTLPKVTFQPTVESGHQASFGSYDADTDTVQLAINNRQPVDILRTLAHELVHASQREKGQIGPNDWRTGSPIENSANAGAGIIMRKFAKEYPQYLSLPAVVIPNRLEEKRKRKKKSKPRGYGGYYGYYWGGSGSSSDSGGGDGGGESVQEGLGKSALVGVLAAALSMVSTPAAAEPSDAAKALGIYRTINRYKDYNSAALEGEARQELNNILRAVQGHPNQSKLLPIIKKMITSDDNSTEELPPMTLPDDAVQENFADGKKPGRKGLAKRVGVNTKASVSDLRKTAKNSSGEKQRMAHFLANMKAGRAKKNK
jgi:hypothetical protein